MVFYADDGVKGREPWVTDGTPSGTKLLADLCPGACSSTSGSLPSPVNRLLILAQTPALGTEMWSTDGTPAGTRLLKDICPGTCSSNLFGFHLLGGRSLF
ncbi:MAG TPA: hyalin, partial [Thermoanaerobaculia bacterium]|nr:hyalin [Thermoanaerobaculia bacterium]